MTPICGGLNSNGFVRNFVLHQQLAGGGKGRDLSLLNRLVWLRARGAVLSFGGPVIRPISMQSLCLRSQRNPQLRVTRWRLPVLSATPSNQRRISQFSISRATAARSKAFRRVCTKATGSKSASQSLVRSTLQYDGFGLASVQDYDLSDRSTRWSLQACWPSCETKIARPVIPRCLDQCP